MTTDPAISPVMPKRLASLINRPNLVPVGALDWDDLKYAVARTSPHFFAPETMRAFNSRLVGTPRWIFNPEDGTIAIGFVTSERDTHGEFRAWDGKRRYTVRYFTGERVRSADHYGSHATRAKALAHLQSLAV